MQHQLLPSLSELPLGAGTGWYVVHLITLLLVSDYGVTRYSLNLFLC